MIRAMELKNLSDNTQRAYLAAVTGLAGHYQQSPEKISKEMIEDYLLYLKNDKGNAPNSCAGVLTRLRFFYNHVTAQHIPIDYSTRKKVTKLPCVLTQQEIWSIICAAKNLKHRLMLMATYSAGLRASEMIALKPGHIESKKMLIKVENGKGGKHRYTLLSTRLLKELRHYYKKCKPKTYLFASSYKHKKRQPLSYESVRSVYEKARKKAGVKKGAGIHSLRHNADSRIIPTNRVESGALLTPLQFKSA